MSATQSTASPARVAANRANAAKSTGPRTEAGKARSRANALKHGLTGAGVALPGEDAALVEALFLDVQEQMAPETHLGAELAHDARYEAAARELSRTLRDFHLAESFALPEPETEPSTEPIPAHGPPADPAPKPSPGNDIQSPLASFGGSAAGTPAAPESAPTTAPTAPLRPIPTVAFTPPRA